VFCRYQRLGNLNLGGLFFQASFAEYYVL